MNMASSLLKFWTYALLLVPSVVCTLIILYYFLFDRVLRRALNNHVIIGVLLIGLFCLLTIYPWMLYYYRYVGIWRRARAFCSIWKFIDWGLYTTHTILFAWATIERHILIFHDQWISTRRRRFFVHYLPLLVLVCYCLLFYVVILFVVPCRNAHLNMFMICMFPCYARVYPLYLWEMIAHQILPYLLIMFFSLTLFLRVLWRKCRLHQPVEWRRYRKMTVQMLSISLLYLVFFFPLTLYKILNEFGWSPNIGPVFSSYATFFSYLVILIFPFVCVISLSELRKKVARLAKCHRTTTPIVPGVWATRLIVKNKTTDR
jgi:hypothetical protein